MPTRKETLMLLPLATKRQLYKYGRNYLRVNDVANWPSFARHFGLVRMEGKPVLTLFMFCCR